MNTENIYVSTISMIGVPVEQIIQLSEKNALQLEFSSGMPYKEDMLELCINARIPRLIHNYFPAPKYPFVLNLASVNEGIRKQSIEHCKMAINITDQIGANFFAAHSGFCIDPAPTELGNKISQDASKRIERNLHLDLFYKSVIEILEFADERKIDFYIENNVITQFNLNNNQNPLLGCDSEELKRVFDDINHPRFGLLLDTAHLKVSAITLGLSCKDELDKLTPYIKALHHSDNDGLIDSNSEMDLSYWFLPFISQFSKMTHVIEVKNINIEKIKKQILLIASA
jgi:hypothetical protein